MRKPKYYLYLNKSETAVLLHSLIQMKNKLTQQGALLTVWMTF